MHTRMSRAVALIALLFLAVALGAPRAGDEGVFYGPLLRVKDGDSLVVRVQGVEMDFRLADVDAPEIDQPYGQPIDTDRYGRTVAYVWNGDTYLNEQMVKRGAAWFYAEFARGKALYDVEQEARDAKRGLWALPLKDRIEPHLWRERKRKRPRN
jgi:endonuclease YncB( thermonuclease family)